MIRSFIGIGLHDRATAQIETLQDRCPVGRSVDAETLHVTLAYLGEQPTQAIRALCEDLDRIEMWPFSMRLSGLDIFGGRWGSALAVKVDPSPALLRLQSGVERAVRAAGIDLERRRFRPHVTFKRLSKEPGPTAQADLQRFLGTYGAFGPVEVPVAAFSLYRSTLHKTGAVYDVLETFGDEENYSD